MTLASRNRKLFYRRLWDKSEVEGITCDILDSGEKLEDHIEDAPDEAGKCRLTAFSSALVLAQRHRDPELQNFYPDTLGYATTEHELARSLGVDNFWPCVNQIANLDETHVLPFVNCDGEQAFKLSAFAAWLIVSMTDQEVTDREHLSLIHI